MLILVDTMSQLKILTSGPLPSPIMRRVCSLTKEVASENNAVALYVIYSLPNQIRSYEDQKNSSV